MEPEGYSEKDVGKTQLANLFQHIVNEMKGSNAVWEDLIVKGNKLHQVLRSTSSALAAFVDVVQKIADIATGAKGATKEIGSALTRLCFRHRSLEAKLKELSLRLVDDLTSPLQDSVELWKKNVTQMDKDHSKEQKSLQQEIRRLSSEITSLQHKLRKGKADVQPLLDNTRKRLRDKMQLTGEMEKAAVKSALIEERSRFCTFIGSIKPISDIESSMSVELTSIQEVVDSLCLQSADPSVLPDSSIQVIDDLLQKQCKWFCQTPPGSRSVSPHNSSFKSSLSSLSSSTSSAGPQSPYLHNSCTSSTSNQDFIPGNMSVSVQHVISDAGKSSPVPSGSPLTAVTDMSKLNRSPQDQYYSDRCIPETRQHVRSYQAPHYDKHRSGVSLNDNGIPSPNEDSALSDAIAQLNSSTMGIDDMISSRSQMEDDLDEVMHKLELSTASLIVAEAKLDKSRDDGRGRPSVLPRRVSMLSTAAAARSKPPPPIRRTSSMSGSHRNPLGSSRKPPISDSPGIVENTSTPSVTSSPAASECHQLPNPVRRTLSSAYANVIETLNNQLTASDSITPSTGRRSYRGALTASGNGNSNTNGGGRIIAVSGSSEASPQVIRRHNTVDNGVISQIERGVVLRQTSATNGDRSAFRFE